jgi:hypothetical protein
MAKTNSLKLVPYSSKRKRIEDLPYPEWPTVPYLMEYTYGKPGEQTTDGHWANGQVIDWRPNEPFYDTLTIDRLERGRSAARFWFIGSDGTEYPFFGQGLTDMLKSVDMYEGSVGAWFIAVKRGANYGIELV